MIYDLKNIKLLGYTTDFNQCECCGRTNLKGTVSILDISSGIIIHFGTSCASSANKFDSLQAAQEMKKLVADEMKAFKKAEKLAQVECLNKAIQQAREEYQASEEKKAYDNQISSTRDFQADSYESWKKILIANTEVGDIAKAKRDQIASAYSIPQRYGYRLG